MAKRKRQAPWKRPAPKRAKHTSLSARRRQRRSGGRSGRDARTRTWWTTCARPGRRNDAAAACNLNSSPLPVLSPLQLRVSRSGEQGAHHDDLRNAGRLGPAHRERHELHGPGHGSGSGTNGDCDSGTPLQPRRVHNQPTRQLAAGRRVAPASRRSRRAGESASGESRVSRGLLSRARAGSGHRCRAGSEDHRPVHGSADAAPRSLLGAAAGPDGGGDTGLDGSTAGPGK